MPEEEALLDELFEGVVVSGSDDIYECPCGCGWRVSIDKATGEAYWITP